MVNIVDLSRLVRKFKVAVCVCGKCGYSPVQVTDHLGQATKHLFVCPNCGNCAKRTRWNRQEAADDWNGLSSKI